ncbi:hypothetical protein EVG20_g5091 [Dentipellis fragilis]|uniref:Uncharacterized protein n=1 Tax=Dentipellis fragilis TaxID=205917 RepID=A0A4Y9YXY3_9AGAM|nr:hypothetical protein EVG20_g5091 [Dentipellis fragilis]
MAMAYASRRTSQRTLRILPTPTPHTRTRYLPACSFAPAPAPRFYVSSPVSSFHDLPCLGRTYRYPIQIGNHARLAAMLVLLLVLDHIDADAD